MQSSTGYNKIIFYKRSFIVANSPYDEYTGCTQYCTAVLSSGFWKFLCWHLDRSDNPAENFTPTGQPQKKAIGQMYIASSTVQSGIVGWRIEGVAVMWRRRPGGRNRSDTVDHADSWTSWRWACMRLAQVHRSFIVAQRTEAATSLGQTCLYRWPRTRANTHCDLILVTFTRPPGRRPPGQRCSSQRMTLQASGRVWPPICLEWTDENAEADVTVTVTVTVTEVLVLRPQLEDRGRITESIRILVPVDRMKQKYLQITTKQVRRSQQFQLRR